MTYSWFHDLSICIFVNLKSIKNKINSSQANYANMGLVKDIYTPDFYQSIADQFYAIDPDFDRAKFIADIFVSKFDHLEWKQRTKHTTEVLHQFLPKDFSEAAQIITQVVEKLLASGASGGLAYIIFPDYIETYGLDHFDVSVRSFEVITKFISCEFAVRPFLIKYQDQMIREMEKWSRDPHAAVRRLASEGSRPRLPWAMAIPFLKVDPSPILPLLYNLRNEPSETVRRSVANNLNDIAKDHPTVVIEIAKKWKGISASTDALIKHASRTLLKQGHPEILAFYGLQNTGFEVKNLLLKTAIVKIGDSLNFSFELQNLHNQAQLVRLEYGIYYLKANGQLSRKVFKISEKIYQAGEVNTLSRHQSFKLITTRKFYLGNHKLSIIVNGQETLETYFELV